jgi:uncharacterized protein (DUF983 family)
MSRVSSILAGKCPKCESGAIFSRPGSVLLLKAPVMHKKCPECGYVFEKEPGYFLGAMYVSYALTVAEMIAAFVLLFAFVPLWLFFVVIFAIMLLLSFFNFRYSRIIWIHMFQE